MDRYNPDRQISSNEETAKYLTKHLVAVSGMTPYQTACVESAMINIIEEANRNPVLGVDPQRVIADKARALGLAIRVRIKEQAEFERRKLEDWARDEAARVMDEWNER